MWNHEEWEASDLSLLRESGWPCVRCERVVLRRKLVGYLLAPLRALLGLAALLTVALVCACVALAGCSPHVSEPGYEFSGRSDGNEPGIAFVEADPPAVSGSRLGNERWEPIDLGAQTLTFGEAGLGSVDSIGRDGAGKLTIVESDPTPFLALADAPVADPTCVATVLSSGRVCITEGWSVETAAERLVVALLRAPLHDAWEREWSTYRSEHFPPVKFYRTANGGFRVYDVTADGDGLGAVHDPKSLAFWKHVIELWVAIPLAVRREPLW